MDFRFSVWDLASDDIWLAVLDLAGEDVWVAISELPAEDILGDNFKAAGVLCSV